MTDILRPMQSSDAEDVLKIYAQGIASGHATFETQVPDWEKWDSTHIHECRWVAEAEDVMFGWALLSKVSQRNVYAGVAEVSIYISAISQKKGIGSSLLERLISSSEEAGFWTLQAKIFPKNISSISLHKKHGFQQNGSREKIALMTIGVNAGLWWDVVLMERRSKRVGD